jgi:predicted RNA-binding Zn ribbon-like protein
MAGLRPVNVAAPERARSDADRALVLDFANTLDIEASTDLLVTRAQLAEFLHRAGVVESRSPASEQDVALARELRSGIREALHLNHDEVRGEVPELSRVLSRLPLRLGWSTGAPTLEPIEPGVTGGLAQIAVAVANTHADGSWERLKICADSLCQEAYYDASKNRSKNWCGATCGNKAKTRAYRQRTKTAPH